MREKIAAKSTCSKPNPDVKNNLYNNKQVGLVDSAEEWQVIDIRFKTRIRQNFFFSKRYTFSKIY